MFCKTLEYALKARLCGTSCFLSKTRYSARMAIITIPKNIASRGELVVMPKKELEELLARAGDPISEQDVLRWSREAKKLHRVGRLAKLR